MEIAHRNPDGTPRYTNHLAAETSPYLRQHAHNPVEWYPWGSEALERARREGKPIHLSIGYAACHWCHVMAGESFEDEATARLLNEQFVNIKVDREERPDLDRIYQIAHQMLAQRGGGWPLTMFLMHEDQRPFFGGTYFPKQARYGLPAFRDVLARIAAYYREHAPELREQNASLMSAFADLNPPPAPADTVLDAAPLRACRTQLARTFDPRYGGFGGAPKFPHPLALERLLRDWRAPLAAGAEPDLEALHMASLTLRRMGEGGINDQLGGGFCRYSVDEQWMIPHFEKMLYDNGALLAVYANPALATADAFFARVALETAGWALREMQSPEGGFYSSLDADSEGHEGRFYVWDREDIARTLTAEELAVFAPHFGLAGPANFEGSWHLRVVTPVEEIAAAAQRPAAEVAALIAAARARLFALRALRVRPGRDEKILTSWNAIMIRGLAVAARTFTHETLAEAAGRALDFIRRVLWRDGRLLATAKDGRAHLNAYLDDYVYLADAVLELQQVRFRAEELEFARQLLEVVLAHFEDAEGGFYFTADDHEALIHRSKTFSDDATPSGNGIAALVLQRFGHLLGEPRYLRAAERTIRAAWQALGRYPQSHISLITALDELLNPPEIVIVRGAPAAIEAWRRELARTFAPRRLVLAIPADAAGLPASLADKAPRGEAVAYVCRGSTCSAPVESLDALLAQLHPPGAAP